MRHLGQLKDLKSKPIANLDHACLEQIFTRALCHTAEVLYICHLPK